MIFKMVSFLKLLCCFLNFIDPTLLLLQKVKLFVILHFLIADIKLECTHTLLCETSTSLITNYIIISINSKLLVFSIMTVPSLISPHV